VANKRSHHPDDDEPFDEDKFFDRKFDKARYLAQTSGGELEPEHKSFRGYQSGEEQRGELIETYYYADPSGALSFKVDRREAFIDDQRKKGFPTAYLEEMEPAPWDLEALKGRWVWHWPPLERRFLYQLPEVIAAPKDRPIFFCEGEKDTDRLRELGLTATTCFGGTGKWLAQYNEFFTGRPVIIMVDLDTAAQKFAGQKHALKVSAH
jgi:hypothetical protein